MISFGTGVGEEIGTRENIFSCKNGLHGMFGGLLHGTFGIPLAVGWTVTSVGGTTRWAD